MPRKGRKLDSIPPKAQSDVAAGRRQLLVILAILISLPVAVYGRVLGFDFVNYDDWEYVTQNPRIPEGLTAGTVKWAFTTTEMANWHPLTYLSYLLDAQIFGVRGGPYHAVNLLFHIANTLLLFAVLRQMTSAIWRSALVASLFAVHPQHVESVAWVSERKDVLSVFFGLLAIISYAKFARRNSVKWYAAALAAFGCSLLSKVTLVTLPCLMLLLDWWPLHRSKPHGEKSAVDDISPNPQAQLEVSHSPDAGRPIVRGWFPLIVEKAPFFLLAGVFSAVAVVAQGDAVASIQDNALEIRLSNAVVAYSLYIVRIFVPAGLAVMYPHPGNTIPAWQIAASVLLLSGATAAAVRFRKQHPYLLVGWFWFLGTMVPMIGIVQVGVQQMADRYAYFPLIGLYMAIAWGLNSLVESHPNGRRTATVGAAVFVGTMAGAAWVQVGYWRNGETLFRRSLEVTAKNPVAHINLAQKLHRDVMDSQDANAPAQSVKKLDDAIGHYQEALRLDGHYAIAHKNLAQALSLRNQLAPDKNGVQTLEAAIDHYRQAIELEPDSKANDVAYYEIGNLLAELKRFPEAEAEYEKAIKLSPDYAAAYLNLGRVLAEQNRFSEAIQQQERSLQLAPGWPDAVRELSRLHQQAGSALASQDKFDEAIAHFRRSVALRPSSSSGHFLLGRALARTGRREEAVEQFRIAIQRNPGAAEAHYELGALLFELGQRQPAISQVREALRLQPGNAQWKQSLGRMSANE